MNNTLTASEIKRRGMTIIEDKLLNGPVQITQRNKPAAMILSLYDYERLSRQNPIQGGMRALDWLLSRRPGNLSPDEIGTWMREERSW
jgi:PHD/YefM family antitoxin component YafN of YafNO toxin-antitoxin module